MSMFDFSSTPALQHDFKRIDTPPERGRVVLIFGTDGTGKTTFATRYCPSPVFVIGFDGRSVDAVYNDSQQPNREIHYAPISYPEDIMRLDTNAAMAVGSRVFDRFMANFDHAISLAQTGKCRTLCIDTVTELDDIMQTRLRGRLDKAARDHGESKIIMKRQFMSLAQRAKASGCHLILIARAKELWANNSPTGKLGPVALCAETLKDVADWAGNIRVTATHASGLPGSTATPRFEIEVTKAGVRIQELLKVYTETEWQVVGGPFAYGCMMQWPDTPIETWL